MDGPSGKGNHTLRVVTKLRIFTAHTDVTYLHRISDKRTGISLWNKRVAPILQESVLDLF